MNELETTQNMLLNLVSLVKDTSETCHLNLNMEFKEGVLMASFFSIGVNFGEEELQNVNDEVR